MSEGAPAGTEGGGAVGTRKSVERAAHTAANGRRYLSMRRRNKKGDSGRGSGERRIARDERIQSIRANNRRITCGRTGSGGAFAPSREEGKGIRWPQVKRRRGLTRGGGCRERPVRVSGFQRVIKHFLSEEQQINPAHSKGRKREQTGKNAEGK